MGMTNNESLIRELEDRQSKIDLDRLDGADIISVLMTVADADDYDLLEFLDTQLARDLIESTQSNTPLAWDLIREWARIDREIAENN